MIDRLPNSGCRLAVGDWGGSGLPLLCLHGFTGTGATWDRLASSLKGRRVLAPDLIGHGRSCAPQSLLAYSAAAQVQQLSDLLDALGSGQVDVLGYSMGGRLALQFAVACPERVRALFLESASPGLATAAEREARRTADAALARRIEEQGIAAFVRYWEALPLFATQRALPAAVREEIRREREEQRPLGLANSLRGFGTGSQPSLWETLPELQLPVHLIAGARDDKFMRIAQRMAERLPNARLCAIDGAGHAAHIERPARFLQHIVQGESRWDANG